MKFTVTALVAALIASTAWFAVAQDRAPRGGDRGGERGGGPGGRAGRGGGGMADMMKRFPLYKALDKNEDGALSEEEIKGASAALLSLDADKDGKLSAQEITPSFGRRGGAGGRGGAGARGGDRGGERPERPQRPQRPATEKKEAPKEDSDS